MAAQSAGSENGPQGLPEPQQSQGRALQLLFLHGTVGNVSTGAEAQQFINSELVAWQRLIQLVGLAKALTLVEGLSVFSRVCWNS